MPVSATASTMTLVERTAASYLHVQPLTDDVGGDVFDAGQRPQPALREWRPLRRSTARRCERPTRRAARSAYRPARRGGRWRAHRARLCASGRRGRVLLHVPQALAEERDDVAIVERVEHHAPVAARPDQPQIAQQPQLMRDRRFRHPDQRGQVADAQLAVRQRVEDADARRIAQRPEGLGQVGDVVRRDQRRRSSATRAGCRWTMSQRSAAGANI